jgi:metal-responsive CopG/Arc/MetJ family transcriptional regulator
VPDEKPKPRETLHIRLRPDAITEIDALAKEEERTRSDMARILLREGLEARQKRGKR